MDVNNYCTKTLNCSEQINELARMRCFRKGSAQCLISLEAFYFKSKCQPGRYIPLNKSATVYDSFTTALN